MAESPLVEEGRALLGYLAEADLSCRGAFWLRPEESRTWTLVLVIPKVADMGPRAVYERVQGLLTKHAETLSSLDLLDIQAVDLDDPLAELAEKLRLKPARTKSDIQSNRIHASTGSDMVTYSSQ